MPSSLLVDPNLRFDSRLALYHEEEKWLALADLHYGYELSQRAVGALFPAWGMEEIEARLAELLAVYQPETVLFLGDLIHSAAAIAPFTDWVADLRTRIPELVLLRGNHDRAIKNLDLHWEWRIGAHRFHHGDRELEWKTGDIIFQGHLHPAETISDGAGLRQKLPALCQTATGWILPAFSPWAAGGFCKTKAFTRRWISHSKSVSQV